MKPRRDRRDPPRRDSMDRPSRRPPPDVAAIHAAIDATAVAIDVEVVDASVSNARIVRIIIDRESDLDTRRLVSFIKTLRRTLDERGIDPGDFQIEVDSPGTDRTLTRPDHFRRFAGEEVRVRTDDGRTERGRLVGERDGRAVIAGDGGEWEVALDGEVEIRLVPPSGPDRKSDGKSGRRRR